VPEVDIRRVQLETMLVVEREEGGRRKLERSKLI